MTRKDKKATSDTKVMVQISETNHLNPLDMFKTYKTHYKLTQICEINDLSSHLVQGFRHHQGSELGFTRGFLPNPYWGGACHNLWLALIHDRPVNNDA